MTTETRSFSDRCYRWLLRVLPEEFRGEFASDMEETFRAQREELQRVDAGFAPQRVLAVGLDINFSKFSESGNRALSRRLLEKIQALPGVLSAAVSSSFPLDPDNLGGGGRPQRFQVEGDPKPESETPPVTAQRIASPDYFRTLGIPLIAGRTFLDSDKEDATPVVIVNRALALRRWGREDPTGRRIQFDDHRWLKIVGVVGDVKEFGLDRDVPYQVYGALAQSPNPGSLLVRTAGDPMRLAGMVRRVVHEVDPEVAITQVATLEQVRADSVSSPRTIASLFGLFGVLALIIAVAGIASMLALWVRQRTREIGIRIALGASPGDIVATVIRQGMLLAVLGLAIGMGGALGLTGFLKRLLFQVQPTDSATFVLVAGLLVAAALLACLAPARRAARIDPQTALHCE